MAQRGEASVLVVVGLMAAGCTAVLSATGGPDGGGARSDAAVDAQASSDAAAPVVVPRVSVEAPLDGAVFVRDAVVEGELAARVAFTVRASGVARVELRADETFVLGEPDAAGHLEHAFFADGERAIVAVGLDEAGVELARDELTITIEPPADESCHGILDALGIEWAAASATRGIADPVRVQPIINGVRFRYFANSEPTAMLMDCELGPRLHALADLLAAYGIDEVIHMGIYNYRYIGGGDPDSGTCTPSQHAQARAIDLHAFGLATSDETYSTETDWVITSGEGCPFESSSEKDRVLKEIACAMWSERLFNIVLTPNYNSAHRNHFHVDLTEGSMYIGLSVSGVDPALPGLGD